MQHSATLFTPVPVQIKLTEFGHKSEEKLWVRTRCSTLLRAVQLAYIPLLVVSLYHGHGKPSTHKRWHQASTCVHVCLYEAQWNRTLYWNKQTDNQPCIGASSPYSMCCQEALTERETKGTHFSWYCGELLPPLFEIETNGSPQYLEGLIERTPDLYLSELQAALSEARGVDVSEETILRSLCVEDLQGKKWVFSYPPSIYDVLKSENLGLPPCAWVKRGLTCRVPDTSGTRVLAWAARFSGRVCM